jgi:hypothetical protein
MPEVCADNRGILVNTLLESSLTGLDISCVWLEQLCGHFNQQMIYGPHF